MSQEKEKMKILLLRDMQKKHLLIYFKRKLLLTIACKIVNNLRAQLFIPDTDVRATSP